MRDKREPERVSQACLKMKDKKIFNIQGMSPMGTEFKGQLV